MKKKNGQSTWKDTISLYVFVRKELAFIRMLFVYEWPMTLVFRTLLGERTEPSRPIVFIILSRRLSMLTDKRTRVNYFTYILIVSKRLGAVLLFQCALDLMEHKTRVTRRVVGSSCYTRATWWERKKYVRLTGLGGAKSQ